MVEARRWQGSIAARWLKAESRQLNAERGEGERIWGSMIKQALKRRQPGFNESYHGFAGFNELLEEAQARGLVKLEHDEKSGGYIVRVPK